MLLRTCKLFHVIPILGKCQQRLSHLKQTSKFPMPDHSGHQRGKLTRIEEKYCLKTCYLDLIDVQFTHDSNNIMIETSNEKLKRLIGCCVRSNIRTILNQSNVIKMIKFMKYQRRFPMPGRHRKNFLEKRKKRLTDRIRPQSGAMIDRNANEQQRISLHEARTNAT